MAKEKTVLVIGTLDTKGSEFAYLKSRIEGQGCHVLMADVGVLGNPAFAADVTREQVAEAGGMSLADLVAKEDRGQAIETMMKGMTRLTREFYDQGRFDGVASMGGSGNATIATAAMRGLPVGVPKVIATTVASIDSRSYFGTKDLTMMYSVLDICGLNRLSRQILDNLAGSICGMVAIEKEAVAEERPIISATMFGVTTQCVEHAKELVEKAGYETFVFHATGTGGRTMEELIEDGYVSGVLDITTTEWADEIVGGTLGAGPHRLEAAGRKRIPQVIAPGAVDMVNFGPLETVPEGFKNRKFYKHNPTVTLMRTSPEDNALIGKMLAEKANMAAGPTAIFLPLKGVSAIDRDGQPFQDDAADQALFAAVRENLDTAKVKLVEMDVNINDPAFAEAMATELLSMIGK